MAGQGQINLEMLIRVVADQARRELGATAGEARGLTEAAKEVGTAGSTSAAQMDELAARSASAASAIAPLNARLHEQARVTGAATAANASLIAQGNDIVMMTMAGQSPLMLALQQGTQVSQQLTALSTGGMSVARALGTSLLGLVSPLNLATIAVIGLGAAGIQWLTSIGDEVPTVEDAFSRLNEKVEAYIASSRRAGASTADLTKEFGTQAEEIRGLLQEMAERDRRAAVKAAKEASEAVRTNLSLYDGSDAEMGNQLELLDLFGLNTWSGADRGIINDVLAGFSDVARASNVEDQIAAVETLRERFSAAAAAAGGVNEAEQATLDTLTEQLLMLQKLQAARQQEFKSAYVTPAIEAFQTGFGKLTDYGETKAQANAISREMTQQAELSRAILLHGENSAQVEAVRAAHAREALQVRLAEAGVARGSFEEQKALADFEAAQNVERARAAAERGAAAGQIVADLSQQIALSDAILRHGENSAEVDKVRAAQAREAMKARLDELELAPDMIDMALKLLEIDQARAQAIKEAEAARQASDLMAGLQNEAAIAQAMLTYGRDSVQVKELQIAADRRAFAQQVEALPIAQAMKDALMAQWEASRGLASADPYGAIAAGQQLLRGQADRITELRLELSLAGQTEAVRLRMLALYRVEQEIRDQGIASSSDLAEQLRSGAVEEAALEQRLDRITDAWGRVDGAAGSAIDKMIDGLTGGGLDDALKNVGQELLNLWSELALKNPLKNAILGQDLPTMADVGGLGGIFQRLTGGGKGGALDLSVSTMSAPSMAVTTPMVTINAGSIAGLPVGAAGVVPGTSGAATAGLPGAGNVQAQVWSYFQGKGLAPHQIAAIMGNASAESGFDPLAVGDGGTSFGLFQHHAGRGQGLLASVGGAAGLGNVQAQLDFVWQELLSGENGVLKRLMAASDLQSATQAFVGYERPAGYSAQNPAGAMHYDKRLAAAEAAMVKFGDTTLAAQAQLGQLGTGAAGLGSGLQTFGASLAGTIQGIAGQHGIGGAVAGGLLGWIGKTLEIPGFATGGWTGAGHPSAVAGVVHAEEYVFDAAATRRIGVDNLEALRRGSLKGYRSGGYVTGGTPPMSRAGREEGGGSEALARRVVHEINVSGTGDRQIFEGVHAAISASFDQFSRDFLPGEVRAIVNDKWRS